MRELLAGVGFRSFNSRTREGCDAKGYEVSSAAVVSIHAPARGAIYRLMDSRVSVCFNSRTREGCDA